MTLMTDPMAGISECKMERGSPTPQRFYKPTNQWRGEKAHLLSDWSSQHGAIADALAKQAAYVFPRTHQLETFVQYTPVAEVQPSTELEHIEFIIRQSRRILDLGEDWDGQGSPGYTEEVWQRATSFLRVNATRFQYATRRTLTTPRIENGPEGGIDIYWKGNDRKLFIHVAQDASTPITFFGYDDKTEVKGEVSPGTNIQWLLNWLMR